MKRVEVKEGLSYTADQHKLLYSGIMDKEGNEVKQDDILETSKFGKFRVYLVAGGFVMKSRHWMSDLRDIRHEDSFIYQPLSDIQTMTWITQTCKIIGNHNKK